MRLRQQEAIARLGEFALACQDVNSLFDEAVRVVADTLEMQFCKILQLQPDGESLLLRAGVGWKEGLVGTAEVGANMDSQAGFTLMSDEPVIVKDLRAETRFTGPTLLHDHNIISGMSVIIPGKDGPFGVLGVHSPEHYAFGANDTRFIKAVASILATAIQRVSTEEALQRSKDQLAVILHGITEGITVQDRQGRLVYVNHAAARMMGCETSEEALITPLKELQSRFTLLDEEGSPIPYDQLPGRQVLSGSEKHASRRIRFRVNATGEERWSIIDAVPNEDENGCVYQVVNIFRDITDMVYSEQYQRFLAEVGDLLASSLDYENTLKHVAQLAVNNLADWCSIYLQTDNNEVTQLTVAHRDPAMVSLAEEYQQKYPLDMARNDGVPKVLRTGQPEYYPSIPDELLNRTIRDPEQRAIVHALGMRAALIVPLIARDRILGAISLIWAESGHRHTRRDVELSHELARRAAIAVDNARLYKESQAMNAELEQRVESRTAELVASNQQLAREIEERRRTEQALQKSEVMLRSLFESAPDAILLVDQEGKIARVNQQGEALFGYSRDEMIGKSIDSLIPQRFRRSHGGQRQQYMHNTSTRSMGAGLELFAARKDGSEFPVDIMLSPVQMEEGKMVICAVRNISEQKRMQAELAETHRRLFESVESERLRIAQDLHDGPIQDLYGITFNLEMLRSAVDTPEKIEEVEDTVNNVQSIVQTLRSLCGELRPPILDKFGLEKAIHSHLVKVQDNHPDMEVESHLDSDRLELPERIRIALYRVYQTAISNVLRHAEASKVTVDFRIASDKIELTIQDNGKGFVMPEKWINLAREGHFGLVGIAERAEAIGGTLRVDSKLGEGTLIQVTVPVNGVFHQS